MRSGFTLIGVATIGVAALGLGAARAGEPGFFAHSWGVTADGTPASNEASWHLYTGRRKLESGTPWSGGDVQVSLPSGESEFRRSRPLDKANPWGSGEIAPSVPALQRSAVDERL